MAATWTARHSDIRRQIAEAELRTSAQTTALVALGRAGADTTEIEQQLWHAMNVLGDLRQQRWTLDSTARKEP